MTSNRRNHSLLALLAVACIAGGPAAAQTADQESFLFVNELGDVMQVSTANTAKLHVTGEVGMETAGFFRGVFDDVPEDLDAVEIGPTLRLTLELPSAGLVREPSLTVGSGNNFWTDEVLPTDDDSLDDWFESDNFVGLATGLGEDWQAALTYTHYGSPNDVSPTAEEVAVAAKYAGLSLGGVALAPQLKAAFPVDEGEGAFLQLSTAPALPRSGFLGSDVSITLPLTLGLGIADYYGPETDEAAYLSAGAAVSVPLPLPPDYENWALGASASLLWREDDLADADPPVADGENVVAIGGLAITVAY